MIIWFANTKENQNIGTVEAIARLHSVQWPDQTCPIHILVILACFDHQNWVLDNLTKIFEILKVKVAIK